MVSAGGLRESRPGAASGCGNTCQERQGLTPVCFLSSWQFMISFDLSSLWEPHTLTHTLSHISGHSLCSLLQRREVTLSKGEKSIKSLPDLCGPEFQLLRGMEDTGIDLGNCLRRNSKACQHPGLGSRVGGL